MNSKYEHYTTPFVLHFISLLLCTSLIILFLQEILVDIAVMEKVAEVLSTLKDEAKTVSSLSHHTWFLHYACHLIHTVCFP